MVEQKPCAGKVAAVLSSLFYETIPVQLMQEALHFEMDFHIRPH
jgi:hypothetical protein